MLCRDNNSLAMKVETREMIVQCHMMYKCIIRVLNNIIIILSAAVQACNTKGVFHGYRVISFVYNE